MKYRILQLAKSSNVQRAAYCADSKILCVEFASGCYAYSKVPASVVTAWEVAKSSGRYFHAKVRGSFRCDPIERFPGIVKSDNAVEMWTRERAKNAMLLDALGLAQDTQTDEAVALAKRARAALDALQGEP